MKVISVDPEVMSGAPCFMGTRVPIKALFDYIAGGHPLSDFYQDFPSVTPQQVAELLRQMPVILERLPAAASIAS